MNLLKKLFKKKTSSCCTITIEEVKDKENACCEKNAENQLNMKKTGDEAQGCCK